MTGTVDGPAYDLNVVCAVPGCQLQGSERHHIWRRSFLAGDYPWVTLRDGEHVGNLVMLCSQHHHMVTVNAAWVRLEDDVFMWSDMIAVAQPLTWQPPRWRDDAGELRRADSSDAGSGAGADDPDLRSGDLAEGDLRSDGTCPTCLRPLPHTRDKPEGKRPRRTWSITVPKDERENGAETLDTLLEEARKEMARAGLPYGDEESVKFFTLAGALGLFVTHASEVLGDA